MDTIKKRKYFISGIALILMLFFIAPNAVLGIPVGGIDPTETEGTTDNTVPDSVVDEGGFETGDNGAIFDNPLKNIKSFEGLVYALLSSIIKIGWIFVVVALIYTGFKFVISSGNPTELAKAKKALLFTIIGGVILLGSMSISQVVCKTAQKFDTELKCLIN